MTLRCKIKIEMLHLNLTVAANPSFRLLPTFRGQKNHFFLYLTKFQFVILSSVSKRKTFKKLKKPPNYLEKTYFQIKLINYEGVILSTGKTPGEIFMANPHGSYSISFAYFYLHHALDKNSHMEALQDYSYEKNQRQKKSLGKENEKTTQKRKKKLHFVKQRKKTLPKVTKALGLSVNSLTSCSLVEHFRTLTLLGWVLSLPLPLPQASLPNILWLS